DAVHESKGLSCPIHEQDRAHAARATPGRILRDALTVVVAGPPNAGKSSLLTRLAGHEAAIVTDIPGTTRDPLREHLSLAGLPVSIIDTAGLRASTDPIEAEGVRRAQREVERADLILWIMDGREGLAAAVESARSELGADAMFTLVLNKCDLTGEPAGQFRHDGLDVLRISALTGDGLTLLNAHLKTLAGWSAETPGTFSARRRHLDALTRAAAHIDAARTELPGALEIAAEELRAAQTALSEVTGDMTSDAM